MTRKDYTTLAACFGLALRDARSEEMKRGVLDVMDRVQLELELENPRFDQKRFRDAVEATANGQYADLTSDR